MAFGKLLYGSKFHRLRQARGTQGIGVTGTIMYSQLTTGKPVKITSSTGKSITELVLMIDVINNVKDKVRGRIVFTSPYIRIGKRRVACDIEKICSETGYSR